MGIQACHCTVGKDWTGSWGRVPAAIRWDYAEHCSIEDGTLALSRGPYRVVTTDESGNESELWGTFNSVWRLQPDGEWKVVYIHYHELDN